MEIRTLGYPNTISNFKIQKTVGTNHVLAHVISSNPVPCIISMVNIIKS